MAGVAAPRADAIGGNSVLHAPLELAALQADIIPVGRQAPVCVNMEDGIVPADDLLRSELTHRYPALMVRCACFPFLLDTGGVCRFEGGTP